MTNLIEMWVIVGVLVYMLWRIDRAMNPRKKNK